MMLELLPFQQRFLKQVFNPNIDTLALSVPRGNGKTHLAAYLLTRSMTPGDPLFVGVGKEAILLAGSIDQARQCYRPVRNWLEAVDSEAYAFTDSSRALGIRHKASRAVLKVVSSDAKKQMGIVNCPLLVADEPGSWEEAGGLLMYQAIRGAQGKPDSELKVILIGTVAPAVSGNWWDKLVKDGNVHGRYVQSIKGNAEKWDQASELQKCNPLMWKHKKSRALLLRERDEARSDPMLKAYFISYRLNQPIGDETQMLLTLEDWDRVIARPVAAREGEPVVGIDLGQDRAWSAAVAIWSNWRVEAFAVAPGLPSIAAQETRDRVPQGVYQALHDTGQLLVAEGKRVPPAEMLVNEMLERWGYPRQVICDRFRAAELEDATQGQFEIEPRTTRYSEASQDIRALRRQALDGDLCVDPASTDLLAASLYFAQVKPDNAGNIMLIKRGFNNTSRDDVAAALLLAAGEAERQANQPDPIPFTLIPV